MFLQLYINNPTCCKTSNYLQVSRVWNVMNWGAPPVKWNHGGFKHIEESEVKTIIEKYIGTLREEGKTGWIFIQARQLYGACDKPCSETLFGRHLKELKIPKTRTSTGVVYALFV